MDPIGDRLREARRARGVSIEQAARDTHVAKRFLEALEDEDFDSFPGETYLIGFIRTYAGYLGLDGSEIVTQYRNMRIQEQPAPIDELLDNRPQRGRALPYLLIGLAVVAGIALLVVLFATGVINLPRRGADVASVTEREARPELFLLTEQFVEREFVEGERVAVPLEEGDAELEFATLGEQVALESAAGVVLVGEGEERILDLTGEGSADLRVAVRRIYLEEEPPYVVARLDRVVRGAPEAVPAARDMSGDEREELQLGETIEPSRRRGATVILEAESPQPFSLEAEFSGPTLFRLEADDEPRDERFLQNGDFIRISVRERVRIWAANAGAVRLRVGGEPVTLGDAGEVVAAMVRWDPTAAGRAQLQLLPMY